MTETLDVISWYVRDARVPKGQTERGFIVQARTWLEARTVGAKKLRVPYEHTDAEVVR